MGAYELKDKRSSSSFAQGFNFAVHQIVQGAGGVSKYAGTSLAMGKKQIDARLPNSPDELLNDPDWKEITHPSAKENGHRTFENKAKEEKLRYGEAAPGASGHEGKSHWHRHNPDKTSRHNGYLDANDNPTPKNSEESHLYPS